MNISGINNYYKFISKLSENKSNNLISFRSIRKDSFESSSSPEKEICESDRVKNEINNINTILSELNNTNQTLLSKLKNDSLPEEEKYDISRELKNNKNKIKRLEIKKEQYYTYLSHYETHRETAFLYNPDLPDNEKSKLLEKNHNIKNVNSIMWQLSLYGSSIIQKWIDDGNLEIDEFNKEKYVDTNFEKNRNFLDFIESRIPTSIPASELAYKYNISENCLAGYIKEGKIIPLASTSKGVIYNFMVDMNDEVNKSTIESHLKRTPVPSPKYHKKYSNSGNILVPVKYLSDLGFGTPKMLFELVKKGELKGIIKQIKKDGKTGYSVKVNIGDNNTENKLSILRDENPSVMELKEFAAKHNIRISDLKNYIEQGKLDFIHEYVLEFDYNKVFLDLNSEKNQGFLENLYFERRLDKIALNEHKEEQREEQSIRMRLVWKFCPVMRMTASNIAKHDGYLSSIIAKKENGEDLTNAEEIKLLSYYKSVWLASGNEEFKNAVKKANEIIKQYKENGIDSLPEDIRQIFK